MKLSSFALPILSASTAFALFPGPPGPPRPFRRTLTQDTCGCLDTDLTLKEVLDSQGKATVAGHLDACLCTADVVAFVKSNVVAQKAVKLVGDSTKVETLISNMITGLPSASHCSYPDHASALCTDSNPCNFECADGYLPFPPDRPTSCKCPEQLMECDGKCGHFKQCPSKPAPSRRVNEPKCADGLTMCGVPDTTGQPWKCVDVKTDVETCGGCVKACSYGKAPVNGVNCKNIKGVIRDTVTCGNGHCIVKDCAKGYIVSPASDTCIPMSKQESEAAIPNPSGSTGNAEVPKVSRDERTAALKNGAVMPNTPIGVPVGGSKIPRDVTGGIQQSAEVVVKPVLGATERLTAGGSAEAAKVVSPVVGGAESFTGSFKATRDAGLVHGPAPIDGAVKGFNAHKGALAGMHGTRGFSKRLIPGAGTYFEDAKAVVPGMTPVHAA
ncbi:hypothetical protein F4604DRAFT_1763545 [Suillus subluteus]|nr:hypothetical protein F4604DRAFT_1763545 [Suillus subluteus]